MGNLLSLLNDKGPVPKVDFYVDFEKAEPSETEQEVFSRVYEVLKKAPELLQDLRDYKGAGEEIREAISHPTSDVHQERAWQKVCPLVLRLRSYYDYAQELETVLGDILSTICSPEMTALEHLEKQQAITKQLAEMLDFILTFDDLKMTNPAIQNDFSYYRRTLNRRKMEELSMGVAGAPEVSDDLANRMSLFYANPTPMLNTLSTATSRLITEGNPQVTMENATECLSTMASVCRVINENPVYYSRFKNESTVLFCLRVMVGVIILYDHVHPVGAFAKKAAIDMKASIKVIKEHPQSAEGLLNALKYNTKHFNDEATPKATKTLLSS